MEKPKQQSSTSDLIPVDLLIDIFSRVPANSIARFRCVSKFWESILRRHDFTELFLTKSVARPRLLFAFKVNEELLFFSSPQPQSPDEIPCLVATPYKYFPKKNLTRISTPLCGLVFLQSWKRKAPVICNPVTGDSITLPKVNATCFGEFYFGFGFDPISKQFKVLCMTRLGKRTPNTHHWILTLESGKLLWRTVDCKPYYHHYNTHGEICINGVLYYGGYFEESNIIVSFDFRSEKFSFINRNEGTLYEEHWTLFNYKGKLGAYDFSLGRLMLWVLEDAGKHKWSKSVCILPSIVSRNMFVGMTGIGEIVFSPYMCYLSDPFYIFFYNIERKTYTRVNIKGFEEFKDHFTFVHTLIDFVEDMKFM